MVRCASRVCAFLLIPPFPWLPFDMPLDDEYSDSASDFPLMTAVEMSVVMGTFVDSRVNFVTGSAMMEQNRAELYVDDQVCSQSRVWISISLGEILPSGT